MFALRRVDRGFPEVAVEFGDLLGALAKYFCCHLSVLIVLVRAESSFLKHVSITSKSIDGEVDDPRFGLGEVHFDPNTPRISEEHISSLSINVLSVGPGASWRFFAVKPASFSIEAIARSEIPIVVNPFFNIKFTQLLTTHLIQYEGGDHPQFVGELVGEFADGDFIRRHLFLAFLFVFDELFGELEGVVEVGAELLPANASFSCFSG
ncbi:MAG: hypothetical protein PGMFKBFP_00408 [Anaerolineales bacterium]|nr:hypothetical protein [Anaerolineales bacterium]